MRIATVATGGIGGYLAVRLTQAGHEIGCLARGAHLAAIRDHGLTLTTAQGSETARPWRASDDPAAIGPVDAVIFGVKAGGLEDAARSCRPLLGPDTVVVPFLNGVEAADRLAAILPPAQVANGVAYVSTTIAGPGVIRQVGDFARFVFAERDNRPSARIDALRAAIRDGGAEAPEIDDVEAEVWTKFVLFSAMSGVTAGARCTLAQVRDSAALSDLFRAVMAETETVARARGVALAEGVVETHWARMLDGPGEMRASTAIDLAKGAALETPWINGAVVRLGAAAGIDVPANRTIAALLDPWIVGG